VRIILYLAALMLCASHANADSAAMTIEKFGLIGTWATDCLTQPSTAQPGFRIIVAEPPGGAATYTTISVDGGVKTTVRSLVRAAVRLSPRQLKLTLRIVGGDRDGFPLPSPVTNTFEQTFEFLANDRLRMVGNDLVSFQRCPA
jgi:hypothetical protein